ncbi:MULTISPECIES: hypothetical protein [Chryseobacterium]|uniref:DUF4843 domain-containing protein n=1 Tax=Chryseobacterium geocarposphaerae TaxID=1416776 RepID=A0ABU1LF31_9FLAO|nr:MULTISPECIES: hypothetical protein [Chryseobacterium]MDR6405331.1 hypothetical protein [Chryseobacterium geocarposphaerae]MDR6697490.1 hypothetical protein [Chryseobacterium ginsenosidimutans]
MKNFSKIIFLFITVLLASCKQEEEAYYDGDSFVQFNKGTTANAFVVAGSTSSDFDINYGVLKGVEGSHQVKLVFDQAKSTAILGTDFQIVNGTDELSTGETMGKFVVKLLESGAVQSGKKAVFRLESSSLPIAAFNNEFTLDISLTCPISYFVGDFTNTETWWNAGPGGTYQIVESTVANQILVKDFWDIGIDLVLNYNPETFVVSVPEQETGTLHPTYGMIKAKASTDATLISIFNPCTRKLTVYMNYFVTAGTFGNQKEVLQGI